MDSPGNNPLLLVTEAQMNSVRKTYKTTRKALDQDIDAIIMWYMTQRHLPQVKLDRGWVERILILNKCSVERTKPKIDMTFTSRNTLPEFFDNRNPRSTITSCNQSLMGVHLPKLCADNTRLFLLRINNSNPENFDIMELCKYIFLLNEYRQYNDYSAGDRYIVDLRGSQLSHIFKVHPGIIKKGEFVNKNIFGHRVAGIHFIYASTVLRKIIALLKVVFSKKIGGRIKVHHDLDSLYNAVTREVLPKDYGGEEKPFKELMADWEEELCSDKYQKWLEIQEKLKSDESLRKRKDINIDSADPLSLRNLLID